MAVDKLVDSTQLDTDLTAVANAIRTKGGTSVPLAFPSGFVSAVEAIETGGGGSAAVSVLNTLEITTDVRAVNIDTTPYNSYDFYFCIFDATLTASDWIYIVKDGTTASGGTYTDGSSIHPHGLLFWVYADSITPSKKRTVILGQGTGAFASGSAPTNMYIYTYVASNRIKAGSKFRIYGGNYADM